MKPTSEKSSQKSDATEENSVTESKQIISNLPDDKKADIKAAEINQKAEPVIKKEPLPKNEANATSEKTAIPKVEQNTIIEDSAKNSATTAKIEKLQSDTPTGSAPKKNESTQTPSASTMKPSTNSSEPTINTAKLLTVFALILAGGAITASLFMWQRMTQLEKRLEAEANGDSSVAQMATEAKSLAESSITSTKNLDKEIAELNRQLSTVSDESGRIGMLIQNFNNSKNDTLPADIRAALSSAELQTQLTGSAQPLLVALQSVDKRLNEDGISATAPLRAAITKDIDNIRNHPLPDPMRVSAQLSDLTDFINKDSANALPLNAAQEGPKESINIDVDFGDGPFAANANTSADKSTWGSIKNAWGWTTDKASEVGSAAWGEVSTLIRVTPLDNKGVILLSNSEAASLRENIKMRLVSARIAVLQRQFPEAEKELLGVRAAIETYFDVESVGTRHVLAQLDSISSNLKNISLPQPKETLAALITHQNLNQ